jgi:hypothetical protein
MDVGNSDFRFTKLHNENKEERDGKPIREPARAELHLDSLDRWHTNSPNIPATITTQQLAKLYGPTRLGVVPPISANPGVFGNNFIINTKNSTNLIYGYFERIALTQLNFFYRCPTVIAGNQSNYGNGLIYFSYYRTSNSTTSTQGVFIPTNNYTPQSLAAQMQVLIRAAFGVPAAAFTVTFVNGQFVFATNVAGDTIGVTPYGTGTLGTDELLNTIHYRTCKLFGFGLAAFTIGVSGSGTITGSAPNMLYTDYVDICSSTLTKFKRVKDTNSTDNRRDDVICRVYLTGNNSSTDPGTNSGTANQSGSNSTATVVPFTYMPIINISWITPNFNKWSPEEVLSSIDFKLYDMYGNPLFWSSQWNTEFQATLTLSET